MSILTNIHRLASTIIPMVDLEIRKAGEPSTDKFGCRTSTFGEWKKIRGHAQPGIVSSFGGKNISEKIYKEFGLDFSKNYYTIWIDYDVSTVIRKSSTDQVKIYGHIFNIVHVADWLPYNGWKRCYCCEVIES